MNIDIDLEALKARRDAAIEKAEYWTCSAEEFLALYKAGELNFRYAKMVDVNMSGVDMTNAYMRGADMRGANMRDADMTDADMRDADMRRANMSGADMRGANMREADMRGAFMIGVDMRGADMRWANMSGADMSGADVRGANMYGANMIGVDMTGAKGIAFVYVDGMSSSGRILYAIAGHDGAEGGVMFMTGCRWADKATILAAVNKEKGDTEAGEAYRDAIEFLYRRMARK